MSALARFGDSSLTSREVREVPIPAIPKLVRSSGSPAKFLLALSQFWVCAVMLEGTATLQQASQLLRRPNAAALQSSHERYRRETSLSG
jgi:hypothetical protein